MHEWIIFEALKDLVESHVQLGLKLSKFTMILMFPMKLRLNLPDCVIAYQFGIHVSTVSRKFHKILDVMYTSTSDYVKWPYRGVLRLTMPSSFRKFFRRRAVIIDCSEIVMERPSELLARAQV